MEKSEYRLGIKGEKYIISIAGPKSCPYYVIEKSDGSEQLDMFFDTIKDAENFATKKELIIIKNKSSCD